MSKEDLCKKFITDPGDDIFEIVESLVDMRDEECPCVFPGKKPCTRQIMTPFGFCEAHLKTKKGITIGTKWNDTLEELGIEESEEEEEVDDEVEKEAEKVEDKKVDKKEKKEEKKVDKKKEEEVDKKKEEKKKEEKEEEVDKKKEEKKKEEKEEEDSPDDSGVAKYVPQQSEDAATTEDEPYGQTEKMRFVKSDFNNFVHPETKMVVRPRDKVILGVETDTGAIGPLTEELKKLCIAKKLNYLSE